MATAKARGEAAKIQALIDREDGGFTLEPWDWQYYAEKVRTAEYDIDEAQIKPYFELDRVLHDGVFFAARQLYGLTFEERHDLPDVSPGRARVRGARRGRIVDGALLRRLLQARQQERRRVDGQLRRPVRAVRHASRSIFNVANFTKPAAGQPALLTFDDVTTMFHEFGHALHGMLSRVKYPMLSGTNVPRDFVEFPSQFNEHWALDPNVLRGLREALPDRRADAAGARRQDQEVANVQSGLRAHRVPRGVAARHGVAHASGRRAAAGRRRRSRSKRCDAITSRSTRCRRAIARRTSRTSGTAGISASYYAYLWAEVLDHDAFAWFTERGGLTRENGRRFREMILSRGGTEDADALYRAFRGREPSIEPLLFHRGLTSDQGADIMSIVE